MSYTPPEQLLEDVLVQAVDALGKVAAPVKERLLHSREWNEAHLEELKVLLHDITDMQIRLHELAERVR
jgi:hypothetical protein